MFIQAGINTHPVSFVCFARVSRARGGRGMRWCWLMRWAAGDLAWCSSTQVCWGEQIHLHNLIEIPHCFAPHWPTDPEHGARRWIELGVAPDMGSRKAELEAERLLEEHA